MKRRTARLAGFGLFAALLVSAGGVLAAQSQGLLMMGILLVCLLFVICMGILWVAEAAEASGSADTKDSRSRKLRDPG